jgi:transcriptional regulator with XRE-family HTH domain
MRLKTFNRFRRWRLANELTLAEVADLVGISVAMVSRVERGERVLAPLTKVRVARRLGVPLRELFEPDPLPGEPPDRAA